MRYSVVLIFVMLLGFGIKPVAQSKSEGWIKLGEKFVSFKADKDNLVLVGNERNVAKFKIKCVQGAVKIKKINVKMEGGEKKEYNPTAGILNKGMSTRVFDLPGTDKKLKDMDIEYDSMGTIATNKRAKVEIWGKKSDN